ncbi:MAG TPA: hypothetical protein VF146_16530 [Bryobacteraceae bacterium]
MHSVRGPDHTGCAKNCAKNGLRLAIAADHKNPNARLTPWIERKV